MSTVKKKRVKHGLYDPKPLKVREKLTDKPKVLRFKDFKGSGLIRVLEREKDFFPEFALYPRAKNNRRIAKALYNAGLKAESRDKWVLRTNKFNIFVYT